MNFNADFYLRTFMTLLVTITLINFFIYLLLIWCDFPLTLHDPYSAYAYALIETHNTVMWYILLILVFVYWLLVQFLRESTWNINYKKFGLLSFINTAELYTFFEYSFIIIYVQIMNIFLFLWDKVATFFFLNFFFKDFNEFYTWVEWVPDIFRTVCDFFYKDFTKYFIDWNNEGSDEDIIDYLYVERKLLSTYCNHINNYYLYSERMHKDMHKNMSFRHSGYLELLFALFPSIIIVLILIPSLHLLYSSEDDILQPEYTIKIIGHQWYWSYEFNHIIQDSNGQNNKLNFDITQTLKPQSDLNKGDYRLLEVENNLKFPIGTPLRLMISSADVLHCWALPAFGIKVDAVPGRLNAINTLILAPGTFYGQCSELCGVGHGFMPIKVDAVPLDKFLQFAGFNNLFDNESNNTIKTKDCLNYRNNVIDDDYFFYFIYKKFLYYNSCIEDLYFIDDLNSLILENIFTELTNILYSITIKDSRQYFDDLNIAWAKHAIFRHICIDSVLFAHRDNIEKFYEEFTQNYIPLSHLWYGPDYNADEITVPPLNHLDNLMYFLEDEIFYKNLKFLDIDTLVFSICKEGYFNKVKITKYLESFNLKDLHFKTPFKKHDSFEYRHNYRQVAEANSISHIDIRKVPNDFFFKNENNLWGSFRFGYTDTGETEYISVITSDNKVHTIFANGNTEILEFSDFQSDGYILDSSTSNHLPIRNIDSNLNIKGPEDLKNLVYNDLVTLKNFEIIKIFLNERTKTIWLKKLSNIDDFDPEFLKRNLANHIEVLLSEFERLNPGSLKIKKDD